ncbi:MAG: B12-binding domain-containing radical SAM protein [candidate division KSB1 bacterium]|nr:B12-binding domain-containing radical SAM protein [candidate division KSB1 bacterium]MDZ7368092.1 B12-binding domain-containing radical SAM protein [candidate division KSB1 bacterium]MDZ7405682.1 B12-binding domain-containing radical SAM protein [candidate division KSB1 bacterium]
MKALLIQPPVADFYQTTIRTMPVGLLYLAASLKQAGIEAEILDCQATEKKQTIEVPPEFTYLKRYYRPGNLSPFKLFSHYRHYGLPWEEIRQRLRASNADVIGVSSLFTPFYREALRVAAIAKELDPARPVIMGGAHVNACPEQVLSDPNVDFVLLGEGERTLPELVAALDEGRFSAMDSICGLGYKANGKLRLPEHGDLIEDIETVPLPARELIDPARYTLGGKRLTMLITSRGCPYHCTFCSIFLTAGRQFRTRSIHSVIDEIKLCREKYGTEIFDIEDDNFSFDQKRAAKILAAIREEFGKEQIELLAMNGISAANISEPLVDEMKRAGFRALNLALVTSDKQQQRATKRPGSTSHFDRVVEKAAVAGMEMVNYVILGLPDSTIAEMLDSIVHLMQRPVLIGPSVFYATPGTESYRQCLERGLLPSPELALQRSTCFPVETPQFSRCDLVTLFRIARFLNFIKSRLDAQPPRDAAFRLQDLLSFPCLPDFTPQAGEIYRFSHKLTEAEIGSWLARALLHEERLLGMRLLRREKDRVVYHVYEEEASPRVIELFLEKAEGKKVYGVKKHFVFTRVVRKIVELESAENSFRQGWKEVMAGETRPVSEIWEGIDAG